MKTEEYTARERLFREIYSATFDKLNRIFLNILKDESLVHDVLQETYLKLWRKLDEIDGRQGYLPFLYFHARNFSRKEINATLKKENLEQELYKIEEVCDMEADMELRELRMIVCRVVDNMPPKRRQVYHMFKNDGLSYKRIAETLNISRKTVDNHLNEAVKSIRKSLVNTYQIKKLIIFLILNFFSAYFL
jgi:RNA polymerase sigma factor (sigma-70 family)